MPMLTCRVGGVVDGAELSIHRLHGMHLCCRGAGRVARVAEADWVDGTVRIAGTMGAVRGRMRHEGVGCC